MEDFVREFERLFEDGYGHRLDVDSAFKSLLKSFRTRASPQVAGEGASNYYNV